MHLSLKKAKSDLEIRSCFSCIKQLRPHLSEAEYLDRVTLQQKEGYQLAYITNSSEVVAVVGFRFLNNLAWGHFLYVDDLVTLETKRNEGYGRKLLSWIESVAVENDCDAIHLDSGLEKLRAHEFYLENNYEKKSLHFKRQLK